MAKPVQSQKNSPHNGPLNWEVTGGVWLEQVNPEEGSRLERQPNTNKNNQGAILSCRDLPGQERGAAGSGGVLLPL